MQFVGVRWASARGEASAAVLPDNFAADAAPISEADLGQLGRLTEPVSPATTTWCAWRSPRPNPCRGAPTGSSGDRRHRPRRAATSASAVVELLGQPARVGPTCPGAAGQLAASGSSARPVGRAGRIVCRRIWTNRRDRTLPPIRTFLEVTWGPVGEQFGEGVERGLVGAVGRPGGCWAGSPARRRRR